MLSPSNVVKTSMSSRSAPKRFSVRYPAPPQHSLQVWIVSMACQLASAL